MDERVKHRIIGFIVIFAVIAIVAPILIKTTKPVWKSIQTTTTFHIPNAKLRHPRMAVKEAPEEWSKGSRVAHISLDKSITTEILKNTNNSSHQTPNSSHRSEVPPIKAPPKLSLVSQLERIPSFPKIEKTVKRPNVEIQPKHRPTTTVPKKKIKYSRKKDQGKQVHTQYHIVIGSFKHHRNVTKLLTSLKRMGYDAHTRQIKTKQGKRYTQVILNQTYLRQDTGKIIKLFNDKLHIRGVVRRA